MQGQQYLSPRKKAPGKTPQFASIVDKGRTIVKLSERRARTPFPKPELSHEEVLQEFKRQKQAKAENDGIIVRIPAPESSYEDCGGFGDDDGFEDSMPMEEIEYGYCGDNEESDDEEDESFENMRLDLVEERVNGFRKTNLFNRYAREFVGIRKKRSYKDNLKRYKGNWKEFIDCVAGDLAWSPFEPSNPVQPCDCKESILLPAVSWSGTSLL